MISLEQYGFEVVARAPSVEHPCPMLNKMTAQEREAFLETVVGMPVEDTSIFYAERDRTWDLVGKIKDDHRYIGLFFFSSHVASSNDPKSAFEKESELLPDEEIDVQMGVSSSAYKHNATFHGGMNMIAENVSTLSIGSALDFAKAICRHPKCAKSVSGLLHH